MKKSILGICLTAGLLATAMPSAAMATTQAPAAPVPEDSATDAYGSYPQVILNLGLAKDTRWKGECREGYWLDARQGTAGRSVGQGFIVVEESWGVTVNEHRSERIMDGRFVRGSGGAASNWRPFTVLGLKITMVCTNDPAHAWAP